MYYTFSLFRSHGTAAGKIERDCVTTFQIKWCMAMAVMYTFHNKRDIVIVSNWVWFKNYYRQYSGKWIPDLFGLIWAIGISGRWVIHFVDWFIRSISTRTVIADVKLFVRLSGRERISVVIVVVSNSCAADVSSFSPDHLRVMANNFTAGSLTAPDIKDSQIVGFRRFVITLYEILRIGNTWIL
jgi:hypothetical protein